MEQILLDYGLPGVVILGLASACIRLFKLYSDVQEKRIAEARETVAAYAEQTNTLEKLTEVVGSLKNQPSRSEGWR